MTTKIEQDVAAAALWLDKTRKGWHRLLNARTLSISDHEAEAEFEFGDGDIVLNCGCVLTQLAAYDKAKDLLREYSGPETDGDRVHAFVPITTAETTFEALDGFDDVKDGFYALGRDDTNSMSDEFDLLDEAWQYEIARRLGETDVAHTAEELRNMLSATDGPYSLKFDGGRFPVLNANYVIVGWLGFELSAADFVEIATEMGVKA